MDELLREWRETHDEMEVACASVTARLNEIALELDAVRYPYVQVLTALEEKIVPQALALGKSYKAHGAEVSYRKGTRRITYKWQIVDSVLGVLRDVLPETAETLTAARSESTGKPSVRISRM